MAKKEINKQQEKNKSVKIIKLKDRIYPGLTLNRLTAIKFSHEKEYNYPLESNSSNYKVIHWKFKCSCGNDSICSIQEFIHEKTKSCGCLTIESVIKRLTGKVSLKKGKGDYEMQCFNHLIDQYKRSGKKRGYSFNLTKDKFRELTKEDCNYCGIEPSQVKKHITGLGNYIYNGIDRVDNTIGYEEENCVSCCGVCNIAKSNLTEKEFRNWLERLVNNNKNLLNEENSI